MAALAELARSTRHSAPPARHSILAWHGWALAIPADWSPVKLDGDASAGFVLLADLEKPRLGLRWATPRKSRAGDAEKLVRQAMVREVGQLAAAEAKPFSPAGDASGAWTGGQLFLEPEPPGRDVWIGVSGTSGRVVEVVHHAHRRARTLPDDLLPTLADAGGAGGAVEWSVFGLSVRLPRAMTLAGQRLNAGDLSLSFVGQGKARRRDRLTVRQIAAATLALGRRPLDQWLAGQEDANHYRTRATPEPVTVTAADDGRELTGVVRTSPRRRRFFWKPGLSPEVVTYATHDRTRDRLVIVQASDDELSQQALAGVGFASE